MIGIVIVIGIGIGLLIIFGSCRLAGEADDRSRR